MGIYSQQTLFYENNLFQYYIYNFVICNKKDNVWITDSPTPATY